MQTKKTLQKLIDQPIYRPHYSLDALYKISKDNAVEKRKEVA